MRVTSSHVLSVLYAAVMLFLCVSIYQRVVKKEVLDARTDIRAQFDDAVLLTEGVNPYSRLSDPDLPQDRITFYFPGFLLASAAVIAAGVDDYSDWLRGWRLVSLFFHFAVGMLLFQLIRRHSSLLAAMIGSSLWFVSRWPLALYRGGQIDGPAICFLLLSFLLLEQRRPRLAAIAFSASLAIKQMAIFLLPLYCIWAWRDSDSSRRFHMTLQSGFWCVALPAALCLPFIVWNASDFVATTLFPLTRAATEPQALHAFLGLEGIKRKVPFFAVLTLVYLECVIGRLTRYQQATLLLFVLLGFTNTFFSRHVNWLLPFLVLSATECYRIQGKAEKGHSESR